MATYSEFVTLIWNRIDNIDDNYNIDGRPSWILGCRLAALHSNVGENYTYILYWIPLPMIPNSCLSHPMSMVLFLSTGLYSFQLDINFKFALVPPMHLNNRIDRARGNIHSCLGCNLAYQCRRCVPTVEGMFPIIVSDIFGQTLFLLNMSHLFINQLSIICSNYW